MFDVRTLLTPDHDLDPHRPVVRLPQPADPVQVPQAGLPRTAARTVPRSAPARRLQDQLEPRT